MERAIRQEDPKSCRNPEALQRACRRPRKTALCALVTIALLARVPAGNMSAAGEECYELYQEAERLIKDERYEDAASLLERVMEANPKEEGKIRPYGMIWIEYYPHRELGICLYHLGRFEEAKRELETSILQIDSKRARKYLQKANREVIMPGRTLPAPTIKGEWPRVITEPNLHVEWLPVPGAASHRVDVEGVQKGQYRFDGTAADIPLRETGCIRFRVQAVSASEQAGAFSDWKAAECAPLAGSADLTAALESAVSLCHKGYFEAARGGLEGIVRSDPRNGKACFWLAVCCIEAYHASGSKENELRRQALLNLYRAHLLDARVFEEGKALPPPIRAFIEAFVP